MMRILLLWLMFLTELTLGYKSSSAIFWRKPGVEVKGIGESVKFRCKVDRDQMNVYWEYEDHRIENTEFIKIKSYPYISILSISNVIVELEGIYCCCLNTGPKIWQECGSLSVKRGPRITSGPTSKVVKSGDRLLFSCTVDAFPSPFIGWFHNDTAICIYQTNEECTQHSSKTSTTGYLEIFSTKPEDAGYYECNAVNDYGSKFSKSASLTVEEVSILPEMGYKEPERIIELLDMTTIRGRTSNTSTTMSSNRISTIEDIFEVTTPNTGLMDYYHQPKMNQSGHTVFSLNEVTYHDKIGSPNSTLLIVLFLGVSLIVVFLIFLYCASRWKMSSNERNNRVNKVISTRGMRRTTSRPSSRINMQRLYYPVEKLEIIQELGEGVFGLVFKARAPGLFLPEETATVAVKTIRTEGRNDDDDSQIEDFNREAELLATFKHENIIQLLGICLNKDMSIESNISCLLFEYMEGGDLCAYLRNRGPNRTMFTTIPESDGSAEDLSEMNKISICTQIACGMKYLSERNFIHRDLATRNCLISGKDCVVKIADFGLSRRTYQSDYYKAGDTESVPIRWMSPEAILYGKYSSQSDVWAFGVTLWEVFSYALQPFFSLTNEEVICCICQNNILSPPPGVPSWMFNLMQLCWQRAPEQRPSFATIHSVLKAILLNNGTLPVAELLPKAENEESSVEYSCVLYANDTNEVSPKLSPKISEESVDLVPPPREFRSDSVTDKNIVTENPKLGVENHPNSARPVMASPRMSDYSEQNDDDTKGTINNGGLGRKIRIHDRLTDSCEVFDTTNSRVNGYYPSLETPGARSDSCLPDSPVSCRSDLSFDSDKESVV